MRQWIFSVARHWRKSAAPLNSQPYRVNPAAQKRATAFCVWRNGSKQGFPVNRAGNALTIKLED